MAAAHKSAISFGLVHIPVGLYTATADSDVRFHLLSRADSSPIRYRKVSESTGKEVGKGDIVKGYEYAKGQYVVIEDADLEKIKTEKDKLITIEHFCDREQISPVFFQKAYHALPEKGGERAFELLRATMLRQDKAAVARTVLGTKETLLMIMPLEDGMLVNTLFFADEVKEMPRSYLKPNLKDAEIEMAETLIGTMQRDFDINLYSDEYQARLRDLIQAKISGRQIVVPKEGGSAGVIDLMEALRASLEGNSGKAGKKSSPSGKPAARKTAPKRKGTAKKGA